jgi:protein phosphatase
MVADMVRRGEITEEESRSHPLRSIITRALGTDPNMYADSYEIDAEPGDRLLLTSDGLTGMVHDDEIGRVLGRSPDPDEAVQTLIAAANSAGGHDNISAVLIDIQGQIAKPGSAARKRSWAALVMWVVVAALVVGGIVAGVYRYTSSRAYVIDEGGFVAIYSGVPGSFAGLSLSRRSGLTTVTVADLPPAQRQRLQEGIALGSLAEAEALAVQYRADVEFMLSP